MSSTDAAFFHLEKRNTPQHVGGLAIFEPPFRGLDYDRLLALLEERISLVPRFRQRMRSVPFGLGDPVWVDDPAFDITYHVRRSALPHPGSDEALLEFCARVQARLLDRSRPLWEMYLVEGLRDGRVAIVTKTHHCMVDGAGAVDIGQVLLDASAEPRRTVGALWMPEPEPSNARLVGAALRDVPRRSAALADTVGLSWRDVGSNAARLTDAAATLSSIATGALHVGRPSPFAAPPGEQRRIATAQADLDDFRRVRDRLGGTVHDAILTTVTGALRSWLISRGHPLRRSTSVSALVPVSVAGGRPGSAVTGFLVELPVGIPDPEARLGRIQESMATQVSRRRLGAPPMGADALVSLSGFAPPTLHALGARAAQGLARRAYALTVTNVPGPQSPRYAAGARMTQMYPFLPLGKGQALAVAITSYDSRVFFGFTADRDAVSDVAEIAAHVDAALAELLAVGGSELTPPVAVSGRRLRRRQQVLR